MKLTKLIGAAATLVAGLSFSTAASASIFTADYESAGVWTAYDSTNEVYGMKFANDGSKDGFWMVVSDGPNPKGGVNEYAILYGDLNANRITAYTYDGNNGPNSYQTGTFLGSYDTPFSGSGSVMFSLDVAGINAAFTNPEWDGIQMGAETGIWFHQSAGSQFEYGADGSLASYSFTDQMWLDTAFNGTNKRRSPNCNEGDNDDLFLNSCAPTPTSSSSGGSVPAPGGLMLVMAGLLGFGFGFRRRA